MGPVGTGDWRLGLGLDNYLYATMPIPMTGKRYLMTDTEGRSYLILTKHFNKNILTV